MGGSTERGGGGSTEREGGGANGWQSPVHEMTIDSHKKDNSMFCEPTIIPPFFLSSCDTILQLKMSVCQKRNFEDVGSSL